MSRSYLCKFLIVTVTTMSNITITAKGSTLNRTKKSPFKIGSRYAIIDLRKDAENSKELTAFLCAIKSFAKSGTNSRWVSFNGRDVQVFGYGKALVETSFKDLFLTPVLLKDQSGIEYVGYKIASPFEADEDTNAENLWDDEPNNDNDDDADDEKDTEDDADEDDAPKSRKK